ncbi:MAG: hypothetical protein V4727_07865 [Verrucomicrobiota bacterium]
MLPETHPLIEAVTAPLAHNHEHRLATHALFEETFDTDHPVIDDALACLKETQPRRFSTLWMVLPWTLAAIALGVAILFYLPEIRFIQAASKLSLFEPWEKPALPKGLTKQERIILGEPKLDLLKQKSQLHLSDPENPAYYAEYAQAWVSEHEALPSDYLETVARIDPDNAFFLYYAASVIGKSAVDRKKSTRSSGEPRMIDGVKLPQYGNAQEFIIKNQVDYENALALINQAAKLPDFETYTNEMTAARVGVLPRRTITELMVSMINAAYTPSLYIELINCMKLMSARAEELSKNGNREEFVKLANHYNTLIRGLAHNSDVSLINELVFKVIASSGSTDFHAAAERLGLTELEETYRKQRDGMRQEDDKRRIFDKKGDHEIFPISSYSGLQNSSLRMVARRVNSPPPFAEAELKPLRIVEHEFVGGVGILAVALLILPAALMVFLFRAIVPKPIRLPAQRMTGLLRFSDWAWALGLGVALPIVIFLIITRWSPVSGRDWGVTYAHLIFPGVHLVALLLSLLIVPAFVLRRCLVKRLAPFRFPNRFGRLPIYVIGGLLVYAIASFPTFKHFGFLKYILLAGPPALCLCYLFANALRVIFEKSTTRFTQVATAIAVLPAYPIAIVALCLLLPIYHEGEKHWLAKETLIRIDPDAPDLGAYEYKVAAQKRKEIIEILGLK